MDKAMHDPHDITEADLAALADGTLAPERRAELRERVNASHEHARSLADQQSVLSAIAATESERAPDALRASIAQMAAEAERTRGGRADARGGGFLERIGLSRRLGLSLAGVASGAVAAAVVVVIAVSGGGGAPSVAEASRVALAPNESGPPPEGAQNVLDASVDGIQYPYWGHMFGWEAVGQRDDVVRGHTIDTVFYANRRGQRIGYAIAKGGSLPVSGGTTTTRNGVEFRVISQGNGTTVVTWLRNGHTCILAGKHVDTDVMLGLASWRAA